MLTDYKMKKIILLIGIALILFAAYSLLPYILDYPRLSEYGKGYVAGNFIILVVGIAMVYRGIKREK